MTNFTSWLLTKPWLEHSLLIICSEIFNIFVLGLLLWIYALVFLNTMASQVSVLQSLPHLLFRKKLSPIFHHFKGTNIPVHRPVKVMRYTSLFFFFFCHKTWYPTVVFFKNLKYHHREWTQPLAKLQSLLGKPNDYFLSLAPHQTPTVLEVSSYSFFNLNVDTIEK